MKQSISQNKQLLDAELEESGLCILVVGKQGGNLFIISLVYPLDALISKAVMDKYVCVCT